MTSILKLIRNNTVEKLKLFTNDILYKAAHKKTLLTHRPIPNKAML